MILLLDTHVFLWWVTDTPRIFARAPPVALARPQHELEVAA